MEYVNKLINKKHFEDLLKLLPEPRQKRIGRKRIRKEALLCGILQVLKNGVPWCRITGCGCSYSPCYRYFKELQRRGEFQLIFEQLALSKTDISEGAIDSSTTTSFRFKRLTDWDGKHKKIGTKVSVFADKQGLPADIDFGKGSKHDLRFIPKHLKNTQGRRRNTINLDKGYTSIDLRRQTDNMGIGINMETRVKDYTRKKGPKFKFDKEKYKIRFRIERLFAWLKSFYRIRIRKDRLPSMFKAFVYLAAIIVLIRN
jgi:transposase